MAAQLIFTKVRSRRGLQSWIARAMSSLPVPVSPLMRTVESVGATVSTCCNTNRRFGLVPTISSKSCSARISSSRYDFCSLTRSALSEELAMFQRVLHADGDLLCDLPEEVEIVMGEGIFTAAPKR